MKFGVSIFPTHYSIGPARAAAEAERLGFESIWIAEHSHMPLDTEFPLADEVPEAYRSMFDPFISLAAAAAVTERIKLATAICLVTQRDVFNCAKEVATLDQISGGRVIFGIGAGWNEPELRNHGTDPSTRFRLMRERVEAMKALWTTDEAEYHGRLVDFGPTWQWPKPVQKPHPPIIVGGAGPNVLRRVVAYGDGWVPPLSPVMIEGLEGRVTPLAEFKALVTELRRLAEEAGRPRPSVTATGIPPDAATVESFEELGVDRMVLGLESVPEAAAIAQLEKHAEAVSAFASA